MGAQDAKGGPPERTEIQSKEAHADAVGEAAEIDEGQEIAGLEFAVDRR
jgi:hypothetical protein